MKGTYSDLDSTIDVGTLPEFVEVNAPMLLNIEELEKGMARPSNDIIGITLQNGTISQDANNQLKRAQNRIFPFIRTGQFKK